MYYVTEIQQAGVQGIEELVKGEITNVTFWDFLHHHNRKNNIFAANSNILRFVYKTGTIIKEHTKL